MRYTYILRMLILGIYLVSCSDEDNDTNPNVETLGCLALEEVEQTTIEEDRCTWPFEADFCDTMIFERIIPIPPEAKNWLPNYCMELEERRYFKREDGFKGHGTLVYKVYREAITLTSREGCADETQRVMYCGLSESAQLTYFIEPLDREVTIGLGGPRSWDSIGADNRFAINITSNRDSFVNHGNFTVSRDGSLNDLGRYKTFHDSLILGEEIFYDVIEFLPFPYPVESEKNSFFYSKEYGVVSFKDDNGDQWVYTE